MRNGRGARVGTNSNFQQWYKDKQVMVGDQLITPDTLGKALLVWFAFGANLNFEEEIVATHDENGEEWNSKVIKYYEGYRYVPGNKASEHPKAFLEGSGDRSKIKVTTIRGRMIDHEIEEMVGVPVHSGTAYLEDWDKTILLKLEQGLTTNEDIQRVLYDENNYLGGRWLQPRIEEFSRRHPEYNLIRKL